MGKIAIEIQKTKGNEDLPIPRLMTSGSAGMDLYAAVEGETTISPGCFNALPTGIKMAIPAGFEGQVRPRSGLALKWGVTLLNAPGTIDSDYRGEVKVILINHGQKPYTVKRGDRIAQIIIQQLPSIELIEKKVLSSTIRGDGGFGHTG